MVLRVTEEKRAELQAERGRVIAFTKSTEPGKISLAVPADRAVLTRAQAKELGEWLIAEAGLPVGTAERTIETFRTEEARRQAAIRSGLDTERRPRSVTFRGKTYVERDGFSPRDY